MASSRTLTLCTFLLIYLQTVSGKAAKIVVEPKDVVIKYVGESMSLGCCMVQSKRSRNSYNTSTSTKQKHNSDAQLQDREIILTKNWIIPTTHVDNHVKVIKSLLCINVTIDPLGETDGGNYTCEIKPENKPPLKAIVRVVVLPRGLVSHCKSDSFTCESGHCIPNRFSCDGYPDCPDGSDERKKYCGSDVCAEKLKCEDGRCLDYGVCCREPAQQPPNCTINPTITCCRQLVHPAMIDQDRYYMSAHSKMQNLSSKHDSTLIMGWIIAMANVVTVAIIVGVRYHLWRSNGSQSRMQITLARFKAALFRPFGIASPHIPPSANYPSLTDQYQLQAADPLYPRRLPGLRSDILGSEILSDERRDYSRRGVLLTPPTNTQPPQYSQLHTGPTGPPPSYHQVVGAPPPPYTTRDEHAASSSHSVSTDSSYLSLLAPLLTSNSSNTVSSHCSSDSNTRTTNQISSLRTFENNNSNNIRNSRNIIPMNGGQFGTGITSSNSAATSSVANNHIDNSINNSVATQIAMNNSISINNRGHAGGPSGMPSYRTSMQQQPQSATSNNTLGVSVARGISTGPSSSSSSSSSYSTSSQYS